MIIYLKMGRVKIVVPLLLCHFDELLITIDYRPLDMLYSKYILTLEIGFRGSPARGSRYFIPLLSTSFTCSKSEFSITPTLRKSLLLLKTRI